MDVGAASGRPLTQQLRIRRSLCDNVTLCRRATNGRPYNGIFVNYPTNRNLQERNGEKRKKPVPSEDSTGFVRWI